MHKLKYIDLFAGCGGLSEGFEQSGLYECIGAVEWEKAPCETLIHRLKTKWKCHDAENRVLRFDIQKTDQLLHGWDKDEAYGSGVGLNRLAHQYGQPDLIIGGPPCQAYSMAGRVRDEHGMHRDYRNFLFEAYVRVVKHFKPQLFVFENVPGILSAAPGGVSIVERIRQAFKEAGYDIVDDLRGLALLDLKDYAVPQDRKRVILIGIRRARAANNSSELLKEFYSSILPRYKGAKSRTVRSAIADLPAFYPAQKDYRDGGRRFSHMPASTSIQGHLTRYHSRRDIKIFHDLALDIQSGKNFFSIERIKELYTQRTVKVSNVHKYYVLRWDSSSNTIPAHLYKDGLRHIHPDPDQSRTITPREAAKLQSFANDFHFFGSMGDQYRMIGNAVPPEFAKRLACAIGDLIKKV